jgi:gliding motility-associated-like protein
LEIEIRQDTLLDASITSLSGTSLCDLGSIEIFSNGNDQNLWSNGSQSSSIIVSVAGSYSLTRTGLCNTATDQIEITGLPVTANFACDVDSGYITLPVFVSDQSINGEVYTWYLNDSLINFNAPGTVTFPDSGTYVLKLVLTNSSGCSDVDSSIIRVLSDKLNLEIPNVFTPNGDGINDLFQVKYNAVKSFQANVFNRWGRLIYSWNSVSDGWDGKSNNELMPSGTYYFIISGTDIKDQVFLEKGSLTLMGN